MAAATATLDTGELLELILLNLDTKTLLLSQRVDRCWHYTIRHSKRLQQKLFLLPTNSFEDILELGLLDASAHERYNILDATSHRSKQFLEHVVILNDLVFDTTREWRLRNVSFADPAQQRRRPPGLFFIPSWQRMLLTQPPPSTGKGDVMFWFEDSCEHDELCEGVNTLGDLMQQIYVKEAGGEDGFDVHWESAAVRPVKHAVDGRYYMKLLAQRRKDAGELKVRGVEKKRSARSRAAVERCGGAGEDMVGEGEDMVDEEEEEDMVDEEEEDMVDEEDHGSSESTVAPHIFVTWPSDEGAEFANL